MSPAIILSLITLVGNATVSILSGQGLISPDITRIVNNLIAAGATLFTTLTGGATAVDKVSEIADELETELNFLGQPQAAAVLDQVQEVIRMLRAAVAAAKQAQVVTDPSTLTPLGEV